MAVSQHELQESSNLEIFCSETRKLHQNPNSAFHDIQRIFVHRESNVSYTICYELFFLKCVMNQDSHV